MKRYATLLLALAAFPVTALSEGLEPAVRSKIDAEVKTIESWAKDPTVVQAVKTHNTSPPAEAAAMNQDKWKSLTVLDPAVRSFTKNPSAELIKGKKSAAVSEAFISAADGTKVAFLAKTSGWSHKGKAKHDVPMTGKTWQGPVEIDESTGLQQVQVGVPVLDGDKPIGSLVVGLSLSKLGSN